MKSVFCAFRSRGRANGYAAITATIITLAVALSVVGSFTFFSLREAAANRVFIKSLEARYISEAGIEDAVYRIVTGKQFSSPEILAVGSGTATVTLTIEGGARIIRSSGARDNAYQNMEARIGVTVDALEFFYGVQIGDGGLDMGNNSVVNGNVHSNGNIIGNSGATVTGTAVVAGGLADSPSVEWTVENSDQLFATASFNRDIAQSFTANSSGPLNRVSVYLEKVGSPSASITLRISSDSGDKPSGSTLASFDLPPAYVPSSPAWVEASFASPPSVSNGSKYWIVLDYGPSSGTNHWNWRKDSTDGYAGHTGKYTNNWTSSSWTNVGGDLAFRVWIGGTNNKIDGVTIGDASSGSARANLFVNTTVRDSSCPNPYCFIDNPNREEMPIPESVIQGWKDEALAGGTCGPPLCDGSGNYKLDNGESAMLGPLKIPGKLEIDNLSTLTVTGTVWAVGDIVLSNNCQVRLSPGYGSFSGVILTDGKAVISNNCEFQGSGDPQSYIILLSDKNSSGEEVLVIDNNSAGVIYYAGRGRIKFSNNAQAKEATAYGIRLDNGATITYESGLANLNFSSGPSGGYDLKYWKEVE